MPHRPKRARGRDTEPPATTPQDAQEATSPSSAAAPASARTPPSSSPLAQPEGPSISRRKLAMLVVGIFLLVNGLVYFLLRGVNDEIQWSQELAAADRTFQAGRHEEGTKLLLKFGDNWPSAKSTFGFNEKAARYHAAISDWKAAAKFYDIAVEMRPQMPGLNSRAAEAHRLAGNRERAMALFSREITRGNPDDDLANLRLGEYHLANKDYVRAYTHLQAVRDRAKWKQELDQANAIVEREVLAPARTMARGS